MRPSQLEKSATAAGRTMVIVNPAAARGRGQRAWSTIRQMLKSDGLHLEEVVTHQPQEGMSVAEAAVRDGYDTVLAVGGDGTTHWVINGLMRSRADRLPALAIIPGGTANDFPRCLGIPKNPELAARLLTDGVRRRVDVGLVNDRYYATISGVGFDAEVAQEVNRWPKVIGGTIVYAAGILKMLATYSPVETRITIDGQTQVLRMFLLAAANTNWYGGGMYMAPHAHVDDGLLAVVYARDLTKLETLAILPKVFSGEHLKHPKVSHTTAREVHVESATPLAIHADGETVGKVPALFRVVPHALEVIVPQQASSW